MFAGAALFGVFSVELAYAPDPNLLIFGRAMLAIGGAGNRRGRAPRN